MSINFRNQFKFYIYSHSNWALERERVCGIRVEMEPFVVIWRIVISILPNPWMLHRSISRWYRLIIIVISIHPQFHLHTQHKQFTPKNARCWMRIFFWKRQKEWKSDFNAENNTFIEGYFALISLTSNIHNCCSCTYSVWYVYVDVDIAKRDHHLQHTGQWNERDKVSNVHIRSHSTIQLWRFNFLLFNSIVVFLTHLFANYMEQLFQCGLSWVIYTCFSFQFNSLSRKKRLLHVSASECISADELDIGETFFLQQSFSEKPEADILQSAIVQKTR